MKEKGVCQCHIKRDKDINASSSSFYLLVITHHTRCCESVLIFLLLLSHSSDFVNHVRQANSNICFFINRALLWSFLSRVSREGLYNYAACVWIPFSTLFLPESNCFNFLLLIFMSVNDLSCIYFNKIVVRINLGNI